MRTTAEGVVVSTTAGRMRGLVTERISTFKGIPYAAAPFGENRFLPPQPRERWEGVLNAVSAGPIPPQAPYAPPIHQLLGDQGMVGEDCLNLNVWTPDPATGRLPVMVWIPGGAFARGAGSLAVYDGSRFARDGVVCVTINYRLGVDGFLQIDNTVSNRGLLDQVAALRWVQENIEAFGGDPANVTVFGESAGAFSLGALLAMPAARGLFRRAILQSGAAHHSTSAETARMVRNNLAQALGSDVTVEALSRIPLPRLIDEQTTLAGELVVRPDPSRWGEIAVNGMMFEPIVDGEVLPTRPIDGIRSGTSRAIDIMVGTTEEEWRFFTVPTGLHDLVTYEHLEYFTGAYGAEPKGLLPVYRSSRLDASPGDILCAVVTDWFFRIPALRLAEAHAQNGGSPFVYEFGWRSPMFEEKLGSCHALEIGFVFDNLDKAGPMKGKRPPQQLADRMHRAWVDFATNGDPGWKPYSPQRRAVMRFSADTELLVDPRADERVVWDGIR